MKGIIYLATCKVNNKSYVGETRQSLLTRMRKHLKVLNKVDGKFQRALLKYGWNNFEWEVLEEVYAPTITELKRILLLKERRYIIEFDTYHNGYNSILPRTTADDIIYCNSVQIDKKEYLEYCSQGFNRSEQAVRFNCTPDQIKHFRRYLCEEEPSLRIQFSEYDKIIRRRALEKRMERGTTYTAYGKDNPGYVEINIDMKDYIKKAKEGLNRKELSEYFNISESRMKIWRKRKISEDEKNRLLFSRLDKIRRMRSANENKLINQVPKDIIDRVKMMLDRGFSVRVISDTLKLRLSVVRSLRKEMI